MQQRGFTLIELIIVIVILGILAVTAAPRFIDIQGDARASTLQGVKAALQGGSQLIYAKSAIQGEQSTASGGTAATQVEVNGETVETDYGYPAAPSTLTLTNVSAWASLSDDEWDIAAASGVFRITPDGVAAQVSDPTLACQVVYTEASGPNATPTVVVESDGC